MLTCIYHPLDEMLVVEADEAEKMVASGVWFYSPLHAKAYREKVEGEIKQESSAPKPKAKLKGKDHEKSS